MRNRVRAAIAAISRGEPVIVTDDANREDEADLVVAADAVTTEVVTFMAVNCRGLICVALTGDQLDRLDLPQMVKGGHVETNFAMSIDLDVEGSTGISAADRARTIRSAVDPLATACWFRRPGHVFPLRAVDGGVLARRGHTEASVALARLAGRHPSAVICEIMNDDGTMARGQSLHEFADRHRLPVVSIAEIVDHVGALLPARPIAMSAAAKPSVDVVVETSLPTRFGRWRAIGYQASDRTEYVALVLGDALSEPAPLVRLHSECLTGDALGSSRCDCGRQLEMSMEMMHRAGSGILLYIRGHEGRGIGLLPKLQAYALQDGGLDTVDANLELGYSADERSYAGAAGVLRDLGVACLRLLTNNPDKIRGLEDGGLVVVERLPLVATTTADNIHYLRAKENRLGHLTATGPAPVGSRTSA